ncbi:hypothetical protein [Blastopirellula marina]|uniref:Uncharacterized protein n=1 Tax=Blastopirellula marina TaxID=124 RepID=A0A2S8GSI5_9BACT|nr:hypothetical protein [Blastopirellula marina]PQO47389.1 hypothetical protein C5Y93_04925 [Blastopirellula marina]
MIAEPWIHTTGPYAGEITWSDDSEGVQNGQPYADFEREKLKELNAYIQNPPSKGEQRNLGYVCYVDEIAYFSTIVTGYDTYESDSEATRLIERANFLRELCIAFGNQWLPDPVVAHFKVEREIDVVEELVREEHDPVILGEAGSFQPCSLCGKRIKFENEAMAGWHFSCSSRFLR